MTIPGRLNADGQGIPVRDDQNAPQTIQVAEIGIPFFLADYGTPFRVLGAGPAEPVAPVQTQQATITPESGPVGTVFTVTPAAFSGTAPITRAGTLTQDGATVASRSNGDAFTFTSTAAGPLAWSETATNAAGSATATASATVSSPQPLAWQTAEMNPMTWQTSTGQPLAWTI